MEYSVKQQAFAMFDALSEKEQALIFELILSLAPDDVATPEDVAAHAAAMEDYRRGDVIRHQDVRWADE